MSIVTSRGFLIPVATILSALVEELTIQGCLCRLVVLLDDPVGTLDVVDAIGVGDATDDDATATAVVVVVVVIVVDSGGVTSRFEPRA